MNTTLSTLSPSQIDAAAAAIVGGLGIDLPASDVRTAALKAFKEEAKGKARADVVAAAATHLAGLYSESTTAHTAAVLYTQVAADAKALAAKADAIGFDIVGAIRQVDPKMPAAQIGYAVENNGETLPKDDKRGQAIRARWSRYANAVEAAQISAQAKKDGKTDSAISNAAALKAIMTGTPAAKVKALAAAGEPLPKAETKGKGRVQTKSDDAADVPVYTVTDVVNAVSRLADVVKGLPGDVKIDANQQHAIAVSMAKVWKRLADLGVDAPTA